MNKVGWMAARTFLENEETQGNPTPIIVINLPFLANKTFQALGIIL
jgi:hypothetical protein